MSGLDTVSEKNARFFLSDKEKKQQKTKTGLIELLKTNLKLI